MLYCSVLCKGDCAAVQITADYVRVEISGAVTSTEANEVLLELCRRLLNCRLSQLTLVRGESTRHKVLQVLGTTPDAIFNRLQVKSYRSSLLLYQPSLLHQINCMSSDN